MRLLAREQSRAVVSAAACELVYGRKGYAAGWGAMESLFGAGARAC